jgi:hypothetical protein
VDAEKQRNKGARWELRIRVEFYAGRTAPPKDFRRNIEFVTVRQNLDTGGPLRRVMVVVMGQQRTSRVACSFPDGFLCFTPLICTTEIETIDLMDT